MSRHMTGMMLLVLFAFGGFSCTPKDEMQAPGGPEALVDPTTATPTETEPAVVHEEITWETSFVSALQRAENEGKPLMIDFYADWCPPCRMLDERTWPNPEVVAASKGLVCVKIDVDLNEELAKQYDVSAIPTLIFMHSDKTIIKTHTGFADPDEMVSMMRDAVK